MLLAVSLLLLNSIVRVLVSLFLDCLDFDTFESTIGSPKVSTPYIRSVKRTFKRACGQAALPLHLPADSAAN